MGRKTFLFSDSVGGVKASANLYSLIETANANGREPCAYLRYVYSELPKAQTVEAIETLLPWRVLSRMTIDLDGLRRAELVALNHEIVDRLKLMDMMAMQQSMLRF